MRLTILLAALLSAGCVTQGALPAASAPELDTAARLNVQLGYQYLQAGNRAEAVQKFERAVEQDPDNADAHLGLAFVYEQAGDLKAARGHYRDAVSRAGRDPDILNAWGAFLCRQRELSAAESAFTQAARIVSYRTPEVAWTNAGVCARQTGDLAKAEDFLREALKANPRHGEALAQMADLSLAKGDALKARAFVGRFLADHSVTAAVLYMGWRAERALDDAAAAGRFADRLRREFPDAPETRQLRGSR